ncbi:MAG: RHS repeat-associated core domain-containing protein [Candidatus Hydrogenedens sp.]|jgi:RHS repeat-associated protein|nr:RHS repeat-associated core domain-containing protein [Candidatus Hydrogenedens sp.]
MREKRHIMVFGNFPGFKSGSRDCGGDGKLRTRITEDETRHYRYVNEDNWLGIRWLWGMLEILEVVDGTQRSLAASGQHFLDQDQWYDLYIQLDGGQMTLYSAKRGDDQKKLLSTQTTLPATTNRLRVRVNGTMPFEFDDFRICSRTVPGTHSMTYAYGKANQLESVTTGGMTSFFTYDPWGRLATRTATVGNQQYTATYTWRFGDKLQRIDSSFPGEPPVVLYNYDGLGKRRIKAVGDETHYWRWDAGYNVVAEYKDQTPDWNAGALQRFFVPSGHTALAEATSGAGGSVNNAAYTYLAHDHLGTTRKGYNQAKTEIHSNEHLPFGQRFSTTGTVPYHEWTGKPWDAESQMYYFPYRYYSLMMNCWTAADPLGLVDGPNLYGYVRGNPMLFIDILGDSIFSDLWGVITDNLLCGLFVGFYWQNQLRKAKVLNLGGDYAHCLVGCKIAQRCGRGSAIWAAETWEVLQGLPEDRREDIASTLVHADPCNKESCEYRCADYSKKIRKHSEIFNLDFLLHQ